MTTAMERIAVERRRQVDIECFDAAHDDAHSHGELLAAARIYCAFGTDRQTPLNPAGVPIGWPLPRDDFKPRSRARNLERAGALAMAEIDRLARSRGFKGPALVFLNAVVAELVDVIQVEGAAA